MLVEEPAKPSSRNHRYDRRMPSTYELYKAMAVLPKGATLFSLAFSKKAPYFATIKPHVTEMRPKFASLTLPKRKAVQNRIGTVHAIAVCNGLAAASTSRPPTTRSEHAEPNRTEQSWTEPTRPGRHHRRRGAPKQEQENEP